MRADISNNVCPFCVYNEPGADECLYFKMHLANVVQ